MYQVGFALGKLVNFFAFLWRYKQYVIPVIIIWWILARVEALVGATITVTLFILFIWWVVTAARTQKMKEEAFTERMSFQYLKWYGENIKRFWKGES